MKTILKTAIVLALLTGAVMSADTNPPLLSSISCPPPTQAPDPAPACPPAPPVCEPAPTVCAAPAPAPVSACDTPTPVSPCAATPAPVSACAAPAPMLCETSGMTSAQGRAPVAEYKVVTQKKKVWHDEMYLVNEKRVQVDKETRQKLKETKGVRLARVVMKDNDNEVKLITHREPIRIVDYDVTIRTEYEVSVVKNRKVATEVEEFKLVPANRWTRR